MAMTLVSTVTVGSGGAASIEFTNIPQTGKDLLVLLSGRISVSLDSGKILLNGESTGFTARYLSGSGNSVFSGNTTSNLIGTLPGSNVTANTFGNQSIYVSNYSTSATKSISIDAVTENNGTESYQEIWAISKSVGAITSLTVSPNAGNWVQHSTASLYIIS